jgi:hypothetical protein
MFHIKPLLALCAGQSSIVMPIANIYERLAGIVEQHLNGFAIANNVPIIHIFLIPVKF